MTLVLALVAVAAYAAAVVHAARVRSRTDDALRAVREGTSRADRLAESWRSASAALETEARAVLDTAAGDPGSGGHHGPAEQAEPIRDRANSSTAHLGTYANADAALVTIPEQSKTLVDLDQIKRVKEAYLRMRSRDSVSQAQSGPRWWYGQPHHPSLVTICERSPHPCTEFDLPFGSETTVFVGYSWLAARPSWLESSADGWTSDVVSLDGMLVSIPRDWQDVVRSDRRESAASQPAGHVSHQRIIAAPESSR